MNFDILTIPPFDKELKQLIKKYPSIKSEILNLINLLKIEPNKGISLGNDCYKIRFAIASKGKGKSGGASVITYFAITKGMVYLLSIYDKSNQSDLHDKELQRLLTFVK